MPATTIPRLAKSLQYVLATLAQQLARSSGFVQRHSKCTGPLFMQTLVFGFLARAHPTWDQLAQSAATLGLQISGSALLQRCTPAAAAFLRQVLEAALTTSLQIEAAPVAIPILQRFTEVYLGDGTHAPMLPEFADEWPASGNGDANAYATLKLPTRLSYLTGTLHFALQAGRTSDHQRPAEQTQYLPGSLRLEDLGYFQLAELAQQAQAEVYWLTHIPYNTAIYTLEQPLAGLPPMPVPDSDPDLAPPPGTWRRWSLLALLEAYRRQAARPEGLELTIQLGVHERLPCRLLIKRVPRKVARELERRLCARALEKGELVSAAQRELTRWVVFVTNVPPELLSLEEAFVLARVRWQIELLFKLWKSHGAIDESHHHKPYAVLCEVYAKLLAMLVQHWTFIVGLWHRPERSLLKAAEVVRHWSPALAHAFKRPARFREALRTLCDTFAVGCTITKRRGIPATFQLLLALVESP